jgi:hypothetical protein
LPTADTGWSFGEAQLGHEDVGGDAEALLSSELFEDGVESGFCLVGDQEGLTAVTTEGDEVEVFGLLEAF